MNPTLLRLQHIDFSYHTLHGETKALSDVSFTVTEGEFLAIVGPSGCGKSTLLSMIAGLIMPESGTITFAHDSPRIGYMLQHDTLLEWRTIYKNILLGLEVTHQCTEQKKRLAADMMHDYGLASFKNAHPSELSGGMRQRAALIRTLVLEPDILLLDEPFSALDYQTRLEVSDDIFRIIKEQEKTALLVTHDISEAIAMGEQVIVLSSRPAGIKNVFDIHLSVDKRTPFSSRTAPEFSAYFHQIWKELS